MKDLLCDGFQDAVENSLVRHKSILDVLTKFQESNARVNRSVVKAVTSCGCLSVKAGKKEVPPDITFSELKTFMESHVEGALCEHCREIIQAEMGQHLYYLAALCNLLGLNLYDTIITEHKKLEALGIFHCQ